MSDTGVHGSPEILLERVEIATPDGAIPVQVLRRASDGGDGGGGGDPAPGIVLVQEIFGVSSYVLGRARDLAALGYVVAVPELYWRIGITATTEDGEEMLAEGMAAMSRVDVAAAIADTATTVEWLRKESGVSDAVALVGFCFGGGVAFAAAAETSVTALVSYYGSAIPALLDLAPAVTVPSLHHWGDADAYIPLEVQRTLREALVHSELQEWHTYPGAGHAFDNPAPAFHDPAAAASAWARTTAFLSRRVPLVP